MGRDNEDDEVEGFDEADDLPEERIAFVDENGVEHDCVELMMFDYEGQSYVLLADAEQVKDEDADLDLYLFERQEVDGEETLNFIEDEQRYDAVKAYCSTLMEEPQEFEPEGEFEEFDESEEE